MFSRNFRARMIVVAAIWISIVLFASGLGLSIVIRRVVEAHFDHDLLDHARELADLVEIDATQRLFIARNLSDPRFSPARSGMYWQVILQNGESARSPSLQDDLSLSFTPDQTREGSLPPSTALTNVDGPTGPMRMVRNISEPSRLGQPVEIRVGADERLISDEMQHLNLTLIATLGIMALAMVGTAYAQVVYGLRPLQRMSRAIVDVRSGKTTRLPEDLPEEIMPLVTELNGMITANLNMVDRARVLAGSFAHALKTPLAILDEEAARLKASGQESHAQILSEQCSRMALLIDYQTARAKASTIANAGAFAVVADVLRSVINTYSRFSPGHDRRFEVEGAADVVVACDTNDLTELIGNLLDNAAKWAHDRVVISIEDLDSTVLITVEDDGPGIPVEERMRVFDVGTRLDDAKPGTGLGLAIARDLTSLYDGRLWIEDSRIGGVALKLALRKKGDPSSS
ncbi:MULTISPECIES: HAMP domain-containing sensor histidine kinase [unclassified Bradyrhizobium]|uniref:HAMP domain-containing sensor histidine kinase n=1 Tax=unclassified Bradyrhizobium TaxID=2631580 RepID=UPI0028F0B8C7|nr:MULTISPECIES: HAMP domain-containing sensor histidine kinase [unclassified Bradyrhizobium]